MSLRHSILAALAHYDIFDYPLTLMELERFRYRFDGQPAQDSVPMTEILAAVSAPEIGERDGYYFLAGRDEIVETRKRRYRLAQEKFRKAARLAFWLRLLPSVRMAAVCNSLAISNADEQSDIDIFLVCRQGTVWATRFIAAGALRLLGLRPGERKGANGFCLSFFVSENRMNLGGLALPGGDPHFCYWIASFLPIYDAGAVMEKFVRENAWLKTRLPGLCFACPGHLRTAAAAPAIPRIFLPFLRLIEPVAKKAQMRLLPPEIRAMANSDSRVVVSDDILKFHVNDRRARYSELLLQKLHTIGVIRAAAETKAKTVSFLASESYKLRS